MPASQTSHACSPGSQAGLLTQHGPADNMSHAFQSSHEHSIFCSSHAKSSANIVRLMSCLCATRCSTQRLPQRLGQHMGRHSWSRGAVHCVHRELTRVRGGGGADLHPGVLQCLLCSQAMFGIHHQQTRLHLNSPLS
jgi:hypothetical protein